MKASALPTKVDIIWASSAGGGYTRQVPDTIQQPGSPNAASFPVGFPPDTFVAPGAGGVGPDGRDLNGILQQLSAWAQWQASGLFVPYDGTFQAAIGGYPKGAVVASVATFGVYWLSTADDNTSDPDTGGGNWQRWPSALTQSYVVVTGQAFDGACAVSQSGNFAGGTVSVSRTALGVYAVSWGTSVANFGAPTFGIVGQNLGINIDSSTLSSTGFSVDIANANATFPSGREDPTFFFIHLTQ